jgi:flagellar L-ring protein FlgH
MRALRPDACAGPPLCCWPRLCLRLRHYMLSPRVQVADTARPLPAPVPCAAAGQRRHLPERASTGRCSRTTARGWWATRWWCRSSRRSTPARSPPARSTSPAASRAGVTALPGINPNFGFRARARQGTSSNTFAGKGATESSNDFTGTITVTVRGVLPNGHLLIAGEKQIGVNSNVDVLRFSGQVDPRAIQPGNSVPSAQIANVRLEHRGRGAQADAQAMGWLSRVFLNMLPI